MHTVTLGVSAAFCLFVASTAHAQLKVVYSNIQTEANSDVPGGIGLKFRTGTGNQFDRVYLSPDGTKWAFRAFNNLATTADEMVITGSGTAFANATGQVVVQEALPTHWDATINYGSIGTYMGITNQGRVAFAADTTAATTMDQVVVSGTAEAVTLVAREGDAAPGQADGIGYGSAADGVHILNDNTVCFRSATLSGATTQQVLYRGTSVFAQTDVTTPSAQLAEPAQTIDALGTGRYETDPTGAHTIYNGDLNGATTTDLVMVVDGTVKAQEGFVLPDSSFGSPVLSLSGDFGSQHINSVGDYLFRGSNADTIDWVYKNGAVVAQTDTPITDNPTETETYDDASYAACYFVSAMNSNGDYVIGGVTSSPDLSANAVLVLNGTRVIAREGDPVDLNGNGENDDDAYIAVFNNDDSALSPGMVYYFFADLRSGAGTTIGQAFLTIDLNVAQCAADLGEPGGLPGSDGVLDNNDFIAFINYFFGQDEHADLGISGGLPGSDGQFDNNDFIAFINLFFAGC